jgi:transposase-like protein
MTKPIARDPMYRKRVFDADIIELCVLWYITYRLSYRDLVEMMTERGVKVAHSTILGSSRSRKRPSRSLASSWPIAFARDNSRLAAAVGAVVGRGRPNG